MFDASSTAALPKHGPVASAAALPKPVPVPQTVGDDMNELIFSRPALTARCPATKSSRRRQRRRAMQRRRNNRSAPKKMLQREPPACAALGSASSLALLASNRYFPLMMLDHSKEMHKAIIMEQFQVVQLQLHVSDKCKRGGHRKRHGKPQKSKRPMHAKQLASQSYAKPLFRRGMHNLVVPQYAGPCVGQYLEEIGCKSSAYCASTLTVAKEALKNNWPMWFGQKFIRSVAGVAIFHTHIASTQEPGTSRLTEKSLPYLQDMVQKWGEAQMPALLRAKKVTQPAGPPAPALPRPPGTTAATITTTTSTTSNHPAVTTATTTTIAASSSNPASILDATVVRAATSALAARTASSVTTATKSTSSASVAAATKQLVLPAMAPKAVTVEKVKRSNTKKANSVAPIRQKVTIEDWLEDDLGPRYLNFPQLNITRVVHEEDVAKKEGANGLWIFCAACLHCKAYWQT